MLQSKFSLERHRFFPHVAWALIISFAIFVYTLVLDLHATAESLKAASIQNTTSNPNISSIPDAEE
jgi:hypothetical protein